LHHELDQPYDVYLIVKGGSTDTQGNPAPEEGLMDINSALAASKSGTAELLKDDTTYQARAGDGYARLVMFEGHSKHYVARCKDTSDLIIILRSWEISTTDGWEPAEPVADLATDDVALVDALGLVLDALQIRLTKSDNDANLGEIVGEVGSVIMELMEYYEMEPIGM
jgi:hypothetical protein